MDENTQNESVQSAEVEQTQVTTPQVDTQELARSVASQLAEQFAPKQHEPSFDELSYDEQQQSIRGDVESVRGELASTRAQIQAVMMVDKVADDILSSIPEHLRAETGDAVRKQIKELAATDPGVFAYANTPDFKSRVAAMAVGAVAIAGGIRQPVAETGGSPAQMSTIPHADEIRKAFLEVKKREPTLDELKEYSDGWVN